MGLLILALCGFTAAQSLLPRPARDRLAQIIKDHALLFNAIYLAFVAVFVGFGLARALHHLGARLL
jgi:hypothetical protein